MRLASWTWAIALGALTLSTRASADAQHLTFAEEGDSAPAHRYARLDRTACLAELASRNVAHVPVESARGVVAPVRLSAPLRGVTFRSTLSESDRARSPFEILDCRLVLALDDFAQILARHDIKEVIHYSAYRPPRARHWQEDRAGRQHEGALALDAGRFIRNDGSVLDVERHFQGRIGGDACGPRALPPRSAEATVLRSIVCEASAAHLFHVILTPHYNRQHRNHFHLEIAANVRWFLVR